MSKRISVFLILIIALAIGWYFLQAKNTPSVIQADPAKSVSSSVDKTAVSDALPVNGQVDGEESSAVVAVANDQEELIGILMSTGKYSRTESLEAIGRLQAKKKRAAQQEAQPPPQADLQPVLSVKREEVLEKPSLQPVLSVQQEAVAEDVELRQGGERAAGRHLGEH